MRARCPGGQWGRGGNQECVHTPALKLFRPQPGVDSLPSHRPSDSISAAPQCGAHNPPLCLPALARNRRPTRDDLPVCPPTSTGAVGSGIMRTAALLIHRDITHRLELSAPLRLAHGLQTHCCAAGWLSRCPSHSDAAYDVRHVR